MQPFSITCHSCAVKLKVTRESAIGQLLGCPKCGTMIHVKAPAGYTPPVSQLSAHFGDVDSILGNGSEDDTVAGKPRRKSKSAESKKSTKTKSKSDKEAGGVPGLPVPKQLQQKKALEKRPSKIAPTPKQFPNATPESPIARPSSPTTAKKGRATPARTSKKQTNSGNKPTVEKTGAPSNLQSSAGIENSPTTSKAEKQPATTTGDSGDTPMLPNEQWVSESTQNKKRLIRLIAMATAGVVLTMVLCYSIIQYMNRSGQMYPGVAKDRDGGGVEIVSPVDGENDPEVENAELENRPAAHGIAGSVENPEVENARNENIQNENPISETPPPVDDNALPPVDAAPPQVDMPDLDNEPPKVDAPGVNDPGALLTDDDKPKIKFDDSVPLGGRKPKTGETTKPENVNVDEDNSLGKLSALLERTGTSILEIQDLALAERDRFGVGQPKYFIEPVEHDPANLERQLAIPIDGAQYQSVSLRQIFAELTAISGLTFSIDPIATARQGLPTNPKIDLMIQSKTLEESVNALATAASMNLQKLDTGFKFGVSPQTDLMESTYDLAPIIGDNQELSKELAALTMGFVAAGSWPENPTAEQPSVTAEGTTLKIKQTGWPQQLAGDVIAALAAIKQNKQAELQNNVVVVSSSVAPGSPLSKPPQLKLGIRRTLSQLFEELEANTEVSVLADWHALAGLGWTPDALAPGRIDEPTANDLIRQIAHSMGLTIYVVDEKTVLLTTFENAASIFDLRVYSIRSLTAKGIDSKDLERLITESLGAQMGAAGVRLQVIDSCESLIVRAPQSLHRQIETVLGRFE